MKRNILKSYSLVTLLPAVILALVCTRFLSDSFMRTCVYYMLWCAFAESHRLVTSLSDGCRGLLFVAVFFGAHRIFRRHPIPFLCSIICGAIAITFPFNMQIRTEVYFGEPPFESITSESDAHLEDDANAFTVLPSDIPMTAQFSCRLKPHEEDVRTILTTSDVLTAQSVADPFGKGCRVKMFLTREASDLVYKITHKYKISNECLRFYLDDIFIVEAPILDDIRSDYIMFPGQFSEQDAEKIVEILLQRK